MFPSCVQRDKADLQVQKKVPEQKIENNEHYNLYGGKLHHTSDILKKPPFRFDKVKKYSKTCLAVTQKKKTKPTMS